MKIARDPADGKALRAPATGKLWTTADDGSTICCCGGGGVIGDECIACDGRDLAVQIVGHTSCGCVVGISNDRSWDIDAPVNGTWDLPYTGTIGHATRSERCKWGPKHTGIFSNEYSNTTCTGPADVRFENNVQVLVDWAPSSMTVAITHGSLGEIGGGTFTVPKPFSECPSANPGAFVNTLFGCPGSGATYTTGEAGGGTAYVEEI